MKAHYFREYSFEKFLVPEEHIKGFDKLAEKIDNTDDESPKYEKLNSEFTDKYWQYKCEGELYDTKLFIENSNQ